MVLQQPEQLTKNHRACHQGPSIPSFLMLDVEAERDGSSAAAQATESFSALLSQVGRRETPAFSCSFGIGHFARAKKSSEEFEGRVS